MKMRRLGRSSGSLQVRSRFFVVNGVGTIMNVKQLMTVAGILAVVGAWSGCAMQPAPGEGEWVSLFDGRTLDGWVQRGGEARYFVQDGMIVGETVANTANSFLCTEKEYGDFALDVQFMVDEGLNSGVQIRSQSRPDGTVYGYQVEIDPSLKPYSLDPRNLMADGSPARPTEPRSWTGGIFDEGRRGWLYTLADNPAARGALKREGWNRLHIEAIGDSIRTWINGVPAADIRDGATRRGFIALQVHSSESSGQQIRFRRLRIREVDAALQ